MLNDEDIKLLNYFLFAPECQATAGEVELDLSYQSVGSVNLHVVRLAKKLALLFNYEPSLLENGQYQWWPCLFEGKISERGFLWSLKNEIKNWYIRAYAVDYTYQQSLNLNQNREARLERLKRSAKTPNKTLVQVWQFERNPDVVAEVLYRATGYCEKCKKKAPFIRKSDNTPFLEVHHIIPLAKGGEDSVENAIALCPNCHREMHYG